jgi:hypothetical protein
MRIRARLGLCSLAATILLGALVGTASAQRFEISNQGIRATFPALRFAERLAGGGPEARCPVTLEGTFHSRTIAKVLESLIGYLTRSIINRPRCTFIGGVMDVDLKEFSLPWHIRYDGFIGTLPRIELMGMRFILLEFNLRIVTTCEYRSSVRNPARLLFRRNLTTGQVNELVANNSATIPWIGGEVLCPGSVILEGEGAVRLLGSGTVLIFMRLI